MAVRYAVFGTSWSRLPLGAKIRLALLGLGALALLALVLSVSLAVFLVLAPIMLAVSIIGGLMLGWKARRRADDGTIEASYIVIDPERPASRPIPRPDAARRDRD